VSGPTLLLLHMQRPEVRTGLLVREIRASCLAVSQIMQKTIPRVWSLHTNAKKGDVTELNSCVSSRPLCSARLRRLRGGRERAAMNEWRTTRPQLRLPICWTKRIIMKSTVGVRTQCAQPIVRRSCFPTHRVQKVMCIRCTPAVALVRLLARLVICTFESDDCSHLVLTPQGPSSVSAANLRSQNMEAELRRLAIGRAPATPELARRRSGGISLQGQRGRGGGVSTLLLKRGLTLLALGGSGEPGVPKS
jgi:hypothetical protein